MFMLNSNFDSLKPISNINYKMQTIEAIEERSKVKFQDENKSG